MELVEQIIGFLAPFITQLAQKFGPLGMVIAYLLLVVVPLVSILIEVMEGIAQFTENTKKDDEVVAKVKSVWGKIVPVLELLPHVNVPLAPVVVKVMDICARAARAILGALKGWKGVA